jgi:hypothetical protein
MIHIATLSALFIAIFVQLFPQYVPDVPVQAPTWLVYVFYALLLLRWPIGPFVLNKLSKGAAIVDSVSLRSIKGIRFSIRNLVTVECDRIGYSIRLFGKKANRRIGITFEGLRITILHVPKQKKNAADASKRPHQGSSPNLEPIVVPSDAQESSTNKAAPFLEWLKSILPASWVQDFDELSRAWIRYLFSLGFDFILQVGPSIISTLSIRFSSVQVTFAELGGVNFSLTQASIGIAVNLEVVKEHQMTEEQRRKLRDIQRSNAKSWKDRLTGSFSRTFQAAWKGRQGEASVFLKLENFTLFNPTPPLQRRGRQRAQSTVSLESNWVHFTDIDMVAPDNAVVHIPGETEFSVKCDFDPRKGTIAHHSARINANIASVTVFVDVLQALLDDARSMMPNTPKTSGFSSPPATPMSPPPSGRLLSLSPPSVGPSTLQSFMTNQKQTPRFSLSPVRAKAVNHKSQDRKDRNLMVSIFIQSRISFS